MAASQQYVAIAVYYDGETLPQLAAHFYRQAVEERNHAMMIVQYLLDAGEDVKSRASPSRRRVRRRGRARSGSRSSRRSASPTTSSRLAKLAREETDLVGEQFLHWFLQEQREEVASMSSLLAVVERAQDNLLLAEEYLARTSGGGEDEAAPRRRSPAASSSSRAV